MTKRLEDLLGISSTYNNPENDNFEEEYESLEDIEEVQSAEVYTALTLSEKIDHSLSVVSGLSKHDQEMDDIFKKAMRSYEDLCSIGNNIPDAHIGKVYEVAGQLLKTALDAKNAKATKKLKMLDLQIKKMRVDKIPNADGSGNTPVEGVEFDRNELLRYINKNNTPLIKDE